MRGLIERIQDMGLELVAVNPVPRQMSRSAGRRSPMEV